MKRPDRIFRYIRPRTRAWGVGFLCLVGTLAGPVAGPQVLRYVIDGLSHGITRTRLLEYAALTFVIGSATGVSRFFMRQALMGASREVEYDIRSHIFAQLQKLPIAYFAAQRTGDLMSRATNDLNAIRMMVWPAAMESVSTLLTLAFVVAAMLRINARLTWIALIPAPAVSLLVKWFASITQRRFRHIQEQLATVSALDDRKD